jgi:hypothetical protein
MPLSNAPSDYIRLAFKIDRHLPEYVDAYFGPPELKIEAIAGDTASLGTLEEGAATLLQSISTDPNLTPQRRSFLHEQLVAMQTTIRILDGRPPDFLDEVQLLYGVRPAWVEESAFEDAHRILNDLLPGPGPLPVRVQAFRSRSLVSAEVALPIIQRLLNDFRERTLRYFDLTPDDRCEVTLVRDRPWMANSRYLGKRRSRLELNLDFPMEMWNIPITVAHEAYPGHHTEYAIKEARLYLQEGRLENSIFPGNNPSSLISEGIAKNALFAVASESELSAILADCYARAGLRDRDGTAAAAFISANRRLESVSDNQLLLLHRDRAPDAEIIDYGMRYALTSSEDEVRYLRFFRDPLSRSYAYNYTLGGELIAAFMDRSEDRTRAFHRLLSEPLTPSQLFAAPSS